MKLNPWSKKQAAWSAKRGLKSGIKLSKLWQIK